MSLVEKGVWIDLLAYMWEAPERGKIALTWEEIARILGIDRLECEVVILGLARKKILEHETGMKRHETNGNAFETLICRRMNRLKTTRESANSRLREFRKRKRNANETRKIQSASPSARLSDSVSPSAQRATNGSPPALLFGTKTPPKAKPEIQNPSLLQAFHSALKSHLREEPAGWSWGRAGKLFQDLQKHFTEGEIRGRFHNWFKSTKKGIVDRRWRAEDFVSNFNALKEGPILSWDDHKAKEFHANGNGVPDAAATKQMLKEMNG